MTPRVEALLGYFYKISTDPRVKAAGYSPTRLRDSVLACVSEDLGDVIEFVVKGAEPKVRQSVKNVASVVLGGTVPSRVTDRMVSVLDEAVVAGFEKLDAFLKKRRK